MHRASRYRLYPNPTQARQFVQLCGAGRFVYNELLAEQKREYARFEAGERDRPVASPFEFGKRYVRLKAQEGNAWLGALSAVVVRGTGALPLGAAFAHFSRRVREGKRGKQAGFPRFKAKGRSRESFTIPEDVKVQNKRLWVPKVGWIKLNRKARSRTRGADPWDGGEAKVAVVYRERDKWYVSVLWEVEDPPWHAHGGVCGLDRNSENLAADWIGGRRLIEIPHERIGKYEARARHYQWRASRRERVELKDAAGEPVRTKSGKPVKAKSALNRKMAQYSCMGMVERFLQYKAWDIIRVPARNTSRACAECGHVDADNRKEQAHFQCLACGHTDHADLNAARNILDLGLNRLLAGGAPVTGRGEDNEAGAFFMECLVDTVNDPSTMPWNHRDRPEFHTQS